MKLFLLISLLCFFVIFFIALILKGKAQNVEKIKEQDEKHSITETKASDEIEGPELTEIEKNLLDASTKLKELNSFKNSWPGYIAVLLLFAVIVSCSAALGDIGNGPSFNQRLD
tara:strand:- start:399 stop:740 length:342 start_codon:yes stop_codon:yes gene_type:complete